MLRLEIFKKQTLDPKSIVETIETGNITTYIKRDGTIVTENKETRTFTFDYSNCPDRDKENQPIKEIITKPDSYRETYEIHWANGDYEHFNEYGNLTKIGRMKRDGCMVTYTRGGARCNFKETFPPKPTQYPGYFAIRPDWVGFDRNDNLVSIYPDYGKRANIKYMEGTSIECTEIDSWYGVANKIQSYSCPLKKIKFYPSGQIKSEHYTFVLYDMRCFFEIKFNENGQVDNVIVTDAWSRVNKEDSSRIKKELIETGYKGYTEYASDLQERARIASSILECNYY